MDTEKAKANGATTHLENLPSHEQPVEDAPIDNFGVDEKALMRKIDLKLIPWLCVLYLLSFLDRSAIGNAKLYGLQKDLHLTSTQYNLCLTVFFFPCGCFSTCQIGTHPDHNIRLSSQTLYSRSHLPSC